MQQFTAGHRTNNSNTDLSRVSPAKYGDRITTSNITNAIQVRILGTLEPKIASRQPMAKVSATAGKDAKEMSGYLKCRQNASTMGPMATTDSRRLTLWRYNRRNALGHSR